MVINIFKKTNIYIFALRNHLGPPEHILGPLEPLFVPLSSPTYKNVVHITNNFTAKIPKFYF